MELLKKEPRSDREINETVYVVRIHDWSSLRIEAFLPQPGNKFARRRNVANYINAFAC
jgi:hypothetical protein